MPAPYPQEFRDDVVAVARGRDDGVMALSWSPEIVAYVYDSLDARCCAEAGATVLDASTAGFDLAQDLEQLGRRRRRDLLRHQC